MRLVSIAMDLLVKILACILMLPMICIDKIEDVLDVLRKYKYVGIALDLLDSLIEAVSALSMFILELILAAAWLITWPLRLILWISLSSLSYLTSPFADFSLFIKENANFFKSTLVWKKEKKVELSDSAEIAVDIASGIARIQVGKDITTEINAPEQLDIDLNVDLF
ncbi:MULTISPECIES: hypothetical protein [unclassified Psychrobacillus]|uniref:hypothetical protein n=1 Tax=unclassified Psychrobacillus TaxID=2636677 RepID=UPI0030F86F25